MINGLAPTIGTLYSKQLEFQKLIGNTDIPRDDPNEMAHHLLGLVTEIGEVAQADKRWKKNRRNQHFDYAEKLDEVADCFIFLLNVCIYSDISAFHLLNAIDRKIDTNIKRFKNPESEETK